MVVDLETKAAGLEVTHNRVGIARQQLMEAAIFVEDSGSPVLARTLRAVVNRLDKWRAKTATQLAATRAKMEAGDGR